MFSLSCSFFISTHVQSYGTDNVPTYLRTRNQVHETFHYSTKSCCSPMFSRDRVSEDIFLANLGPILDDSIVSGFNFHRYDRRCAHYTCVCPPTKSDQNGGLGRRCVSPYLRPMAPSSSKSLSGFRGASYPLSIQDTKHDYIFILNN